MFECESWKPLVDQIWVYIEHQVAVPGVPTAVLVSELQRTLATAYRRFAGRCCLMGGEERTTPPPEVLPWTDILVACSKYRSVGTNMADPTITLLLFHMC